MRKYIDADELRASMYHEAFETDSDMQRWDSGCWIRYKMFEDALEQMPAADVVEVWHGRWNGYNTEKGWLRDNGTPVFLVCSECNGTVLNNGSAHWNYCPNCGAKMDEVEE